MKLQITDSELRIEDLVGVSMDRRDQSIEIAISSLTPAALVRCPITGRIVLRVATHQPHDSLSEDYEDTLWSKS